MTSSLAVMRSHNDNEQISNNSLPPLREAIPEIRQSHVGSESQYRRSLRDTPSGPPPRLDAAGSLAPSPRTTNTTRQYPPSPQSMSGNSPFHHLQGSFPDSTSSSEYSDRCGSYQSKSGLSSASRSPIVPTVHSSQTVSRGGSIERGGRECNLPPIYGPGQGLPSQHPSYGPTQPYLRESPPPRNIPFPAYNGMQDYTYNMGQYPDRSPFDSGSGNGNYPLNFDNGGEYGDGKQKRRRGNLPKAVTDILRVWFHDHITHPYPTEDEKQALMTQTGLTISQISNWFINARRRSLPQMTKQAQAEAELREHSSSSVLNGEGLPTRNR